MFVIWMLGGSGWAPVRPDLEFYLEVSHLSPFAQLSGSSLMSKSMRRFTSDFGVIMISMGKHLYAHAGTIWMATESH